MTTSHPRYERREPYMFAEQWMATQRVTQSLVGDTETSDIFHYFLTQGSFRVQIAFRRCFHCAGESTHHSRRCRLGSFQSSQQNLAKWLHHKLQYRPRFPSPIQLDQLLLNASRAIQILTFGSYFAGGVPNFANQRQKKPSASASEGNIVREQNLGRRIISNFHIASQSTAGDGDDESNQPLRASWRVTRDATLRLWPPPKRLQ
eukprot:Gregarina_sp_Poly_1__949@NODE_122_length_13497_cov_184_110052_g109_i0_p4_GENE_NODE_122_length_13497_cov_184_110052_g109_i0NODE_122_length_13497_cov_184_110052_g109_i0_p4_ORF_typecomplete_len204_score28_34_NODE_122_length_13497_cov_184_110052_g109_i045505161